MPPHARCESKAEVEGEKRRKASCEWVAAFRFLSSFASRIIPLTPFRSRSSEPAHAHDRVLALATASSRTYSLRAAERGHTFSLPRFRAVFPLDPRAIPTFGSGYQFGSQGLDVGGGAGWLVALGATEGLAAVELGPPGTLIGAGVDRGRSADPWLAAFDGTRADGETAGAGVASGPTRGGSGAETAGWVGAAEVDAMAVGLEPCASVSGRRGPAIAASTGRASRTPMPKRQRGYFVGRGSKRPVSPIESIRTLASSRAPRRHPCSAPHWHFRHPHRQRPAWQS